MGIMALKTYGIVVRIGIVTIIFPYDVTNYCQVGHRFKVAIGHRSCKLRAIEVHHKIVTLQLWGDTADNVQHGMVDSCRDLTTTKRQLSRVLKSLDVKFVPFTVARQ